MDKESNWQKKAEIFITLDINLIGYAILKAVLVRDQN